MNDLMPFVPIIVIAVLGVWFALWCNRAIKKDRLKILGALCSKPGSSAAEISRATGIPGVYQHLRPMEHSGRVVSDWEKGTYPRRRLYWAAHEMQSNIEEDFS